MTQRASVQQRASELLDAEVRSDQAPGLQYCAVSAWEVIAQTAAGWADLRARRPMAGDTTMMAYSLSKVLTAVAVLQLVGAGRVSLDSPVADYVQPNPFHAPITLRQLLSHLGGAPNPIPLRWVHTVAEHATFDERAALTRVLAAHPRLASPPGARYHYSNIGYWLLGCVLEAVTGVGVGEQISRAVIRPLGLDATELSYAIPDMSRHAAGYLEKYSWMNLLKGWLIDRALCAGYEGPWLRIQPHHPNGAAFGGAIGSARALGVFLQDLLRPRSVLLDAGMTHLLFEAQRTNRGAFVPMTLGWHVGRERGTRFYFKEGGGGGFHHMMRVYPESGVASILMTNATGFDVSACLTRLDASLQTTGRAA